FAFDPALENIYHLKFDVVKVAFRNFRWIAGRNHFDHVRPHHASGRTGDAKIAVLCVAPQPLLERVGPVMRGDESVPVRPRFLLAANCPRAAASRCRRARLSRGALAIPRVLCFLGYASHKIILVVPSGGDGWNSQPIITHGKIAGSAASSLRNDYKTAA